MPERAYVLQPCLGLFMHWLGHSTRDVGHLVDPAALFFRRRVYREPTNGKQRQRQHQRYIHPQSVKPLCRRHIGKLGIPIKAVVALSVSSFAQSLSKFSIWVNLARILIRKTRHANEDQRLALFIMQLVKRDFEIHKLQSAVAIELN
jgi:hypothetical protein